MGGLCTLDWNTKDKGVDPKLDQLGPVVVC